MKHARVLLSTLAFLAAAGCGSSGPTLTQAPSDPRRDGGSYGSGHVAGSSDGVSVAGGSYGPGH